jgi:hypothetical protein
MKNFEDIARERILDGMVESVANNPGLDPNDVAVFAAMIYALLRAGARREGQKGFTEAFAHFAPPSLLKPGAVPEGELESLRAALLASVDRFSLEAKALRVYFTSLEDEGMSEQEATELAVSALESEDE